jgi:hypothetical protein
MRLTGPVGCTESKKTTRRNFVGTAAGGRKPRRSSINGMRGSELDYSGLGEGQMTGCCENGRKPSDSCKCGECFDLYVVSTCIVMCVCVGVLTVVWVFW